MLYTNKENINFELNSDIMTANIINSPKARNKIFIPYSILYESKEYVIEKINDEVFKKNYSLKSMDFPKNSKLSSIGRNSFSLSYIQSLSIPSTVQKLEEGWCCQTQFLKQILISPKNEHFKYLDENRKIIVGKSNSKSEIFDVLIFACRDIEKVFIPSTIKYIDSYAFSYCNKLKSIEFSKDSQILAFGKYSFSYCFLTNLTIPKTVEKLDKGWCRGNFKLKKVFISSESRHFKYLNEKNEVIVGKSKSGFFDEIKFANRDIKQVFIPSMIKYIDSFAFSECRLLKSIEFSPNSQLLAIGEGSFSNSGIERISIPSSTKIIKKYAFFESNNLQTIQIKNDSNLITIEKKVFSDNSIQNIFIPPKLEELKDTWNYGLYNLDNVLISSENKNFKYIDDSNQIIISKSEPKKENFNSIIFANHNIQNPLIPSFIQIIKPFSFAFCNNIQTVEFLKDSQLISIGKWSFYSSSIEKIIIPSNVTKIAKYTFFRCKNLKTVDFLDDSKLIEIEDSAFYSSSIEFLKIPSKLNILDDKWCYEVINLKQISISPKNMFFKYLDENKKIIIGKSDEKSDIFDTIVFASRNIKNAFIPSQIKYINSYAFSSCKKIKSIEFQKNSQLNSIGEWGFHSSSIRNISIPSNEIHFDNSVFGDCLLLNSVEYQSENISIENNLFSSCIKLMIISFSNCKSLRIYEKSFETISRNCLILINANTHINYNN